MRTTFSRMKPDSKNMVTEIVDRRKTKLLCVEYYSARGWDVLVIDEEEIGFS